ncbi:MAG TPA: segregation/condensation protein A [Candidatus Acidoferrales bacterium]|nr:segregation/condensation protein A [Candidatus Acidoferrales bacterium]
MSYRVKLNDFEGPLDLLLFFIKRDQLDIYDIPIARIAKEFLEYIHIMQLLDLELVGDFLVMAATLMQIKVKMLLPHEEGIEGLIEEDPRKELADRIAEYARFKEAARNFGHLEEEGNKLLYRSYFRQDERQYSSPDTEELKNATLVDLITAFKKVMDKLDTTPYHNIQRLNVTMEEQIEFLLGSIEDKKPVHFLELASQIHERIKLVVTFIALLELIKRHVLRVQTAGEFNDFIISKREGPSGKSPAKDSSDGEEDNAGRIV